VAPLNEPLASVVVLPPSHGNKPKAAMIVWPAANPVPVTHTVLSTGPFAGVSLMLGVIVNVAVALLAVGVGESLTASVWPPAGAAGTVYVAPEKLPSEFVEVAPSRDTTVVPSVAAIVEPAAKPVPEIESVDPTLPVAGARVVICGATVKVALSEPAPALTRTVWPPAVLAGTVNVTPSGMLPEASVSLGTGSDSAPPS
jgi:hypothetical protein